MKMLLKASRKTIFKEYFLNPKATAKVLEADGVPAMPDTATKRAFFI
ncbi:hypothetical protein ACLK19_00245 [Escherichia coli]